MCHFHIEDFKSRYVIYHALFFSDAAVSDVPGGGGYLSLCI